jgi:hypothetical protein
MREMSERAFDGLEHGARGVGSDGNFGDRPAQVGQLRLGAHEIGCTTDE